MAGMGALKSPAFAMHCLEHGLLDCTHMYIKEQCNCLLLHIVWIWCPDWQIGALFGKLVHCLANWCTVWRTGALLGK